MWDNHIGTAMCLTCAAIRQNHTGKYQYVNWKGKRTKSEPVCPGRMIEGTKKVKK